MQAQHIAAAPAAQHIAAVPANLNMIIFVQVQHTSAAQAHHIAAAPAAQHIAAVPADAIYLYLCKRSILQHIANVLQYPGRWPWAANILLLF